MTLHIRSSVEVLAEERDWYIKKTPWHWGVRRRAESYILHYCKEAKDYQITDTVYLPIDDTAVRHCIYCGEKVPQDLLTIGRLLDSRMASHFTPR
jgi:hypothetical protein